MAKIASFPRPASPQTGGEVKLTVRTPARQRHRRRRRRRQRRADTGDQRRRDADRVSGAHRAVRRDYGLGDRSGFVARGRVFCVGVLRRSPGRWACPRRMSPTSPTCSAPSSSPTSSCVRAADEAHTRNASIRARYVLATYALTGFANLSSIGIQLGGIGAMAPTRRGDLARLGIRAMLGGFLATLVNACIASMLL